MTPSKSQRGYLSLIFLFLLISPISFVNNFSSSKYSLKDSLNSTFSISRSGKNHKSLKFNFTWEDNYTSSIMINGGKSNINVNINFYLKKIINQQNLKRYVLKVKATFNGSRVSGSINIDYSLSCIGQISEMKLRQKIRNKIQDHIIKKIIK